LRDSVEKRMHFLFLSRDLKFHPAIGQITHPALYVEALCSIANRPPKPNALHIALVKNLE
jgi:hypothetical protein